MFFFYFYLFLFFNFIFYKLSSWKGVQPPKNSFSDFLLGYGIFLVYSVDVGGRVYVWKISEGPDEEAKPQITGKVVISLHMEGEEEIVHPRVCWHCHKQAIIILMLTSICRAVDS